MEKPRDLEGAPHTLSKLLNDEIQAIVPLTSRVFHILREESESFLARNVQQHSQHLSTEEKLDNAVNHGKRLQLELTESRQKFSILHQEFHELRGELSKLRNELATSKKNSKTMQKKLVSMLQQKKYPQGKVSKLPQKSSSNLNSTKHSPQPSTYSSPRCDTKIDGEFGITFSSEVNSTDNTTRSFHSHLGSSPSTPHSIKTPVRASSAGYRRSPQPNHTGSIAWPAKANHKEFQGDTDGKLSVRQRPFSAVVRPTNSNRSGLNHSSSASHVRSSSKRPFSAGSPNQQYSDKLEIASMEGRAFELLEEAGKQFRQDTQKRTATVHLDHATTGILVPAGSAEKSPSKKLTYRVSDRGAWKSPKANPISINDLLEKDSKRRERSKSPQGRHNIPKMNFENIDEDGNLKQQKPGHLVSSSKNASKKTPAKKKLAPL